MQGDTKMPKQKLLIVEDDTEITRLVTGILEPEGYRVVTASNGEKGLRIMKKNLPALVILDINMPGIDGFEVLKDLRGWSQVPVIMLSGRDEVNDKTKCLDLGADDYLVKPFSPEELVSRTRALLRRTRNTESAPESPEFITGDMVIDFGKRRVTIAGEEITLTATEYSLLKELVSNAGKVLTHKHLLQTVWGEEYEQDITILFAHMSNLRKKIETDPEHLRIITLPKIGYRFRE